MKVTKETITTEKITVRIDDSKILVYLNKEKETEITGKVLEEASKILNLKIKQ